MNKLKLFYAVSSTSFATISIVFQDLHHLGLAAVAMAILAHGAENRR